MTEPIRPAAAPRGLTDPSLLERASKGPVAAFLGRQRWFPARARTIASTAIEAAAPLGEGPAWPTVWLVRVTFEDGGSDCYAMPVARAAGATAAAIDAESPARVLVRLDGPGAGIVHDRVEFGLGAALLICVERSARVQLGDQILSFEPTGAFATICGAAAGTLSARQVTSEQSNTSIVFGDRVILKIVRRLEPGLHPDYEIGRHLTDRSPFPGVPALAGALVLRGDSGEPTVVGIAQAFVPGARVLREVIVEDLASAMHAWLGSPASDARDAAMRAACAGAFDTAHDLGRKTGALHLALVTAHGDPAFVPQPATAADLAAVAADMHQQTRLALDVLRSGAVGLPASSADLAQRVLGARERLLAAVDAVADLPPGVARIRVHGDYQLDQVLVAGGELMIIDFEGEPLRPLAARRARFFAMKDVAGMVRSLSYAAFAALFAVAGDDDEVAGALDEVARWWQGVAADRFLAGYREAAGRAAFVPVEEAAFRTLLRAFVVEKATYELRYEIGHRPRWLRIPLRGLTALLDEA